MPISEPNEALVIQRINGVRLFLDKRMADTIRINRAPVLTLWAAVVAERLGLDWDEALTMGRAVAGLNAYSKGVRLGLYEPTPEAERERRHKAKHGAEIQVALLHRAVPAVQTPEDVRALSKDRPIAPAGVQRYLEGKFGERLGDARKAMEKLARSMPARDLAAKAYGLYERFRPAIPSGVRGWGAAGDLDLDEIERLA
jgi:hypothetical protein